MRTLLPDPPPPEIQRPLEELLERRRQWGADTHDEVWEGVLRMNPAPHWRHADIQAQLIALLAPLARSTGLRVVGEFNLGDPDDYRVPDAALTKPGGGELYNQTAALVVEVVSPGDDTWRKLPFYAAHAVAELLIVDPEKRSIHWLTLGTDGGYHDAAGSGQIHLGAAEVAAQIDWADSAGGDAAGGE
ncbi:MAG: Uma2 family endonuclease [Solirubrobacteraceae bacterium]